ncbi:lipopolysaccharide transport periplasmic protein LptA [Wenzhouxiangella sediminis]|uniref:Lipopolysaccharide transport periplasmic protein LptA n=1 Tax=Wenzhouxiangella sediminis TaxID=1792836 RepID=A0A3E1K502_9GAMM|nr:lipopolysaccharide transport periplasmic protein LptA [Wenzhouxiangella sediminis]RFF29115.1 lipopolysaccharide transport periplasmic protein LptA [Wenzhouxiangella sediminis]
MAYKVNSTRPWPAALVLMLMLAGLATAAEAQQNGPIGVEAENASYDAGENATHLQGDVRITRGEMEVNADEAFAYRGETGYERIELFGSPVRWRTVTEEGGETTGHSNQVIYSLLERTITLVGEAHIEEPRGTYSGERLVYNLDTERVRGEGGVRLSIEPEVVDEPEDSDAGPGEPETD